MGATGQWARLRPGWGAGGRHSQELVQQHRTQRLPVQAAALPACRRRGGRRPESAAGQGGPWGLPARGWLTTVPPAGPQPQWPVGRSKPHTPHPRRSQDVPAEACDSHHHHPGHCSHGVGLRAAHPPCPPHPPPASRNEKEKSGSHQREGGYHQRLRTRPRRGRLLKDSMEPPALSSARRHCKQPRPSRRPALLPFLSCRPPQHPKWPRLEQTTEAQASGCPSPADSPREPQTGTERRH